MLPGVGTKQKRARTPGKGRSEPMNWRMRAAVALVALGTCFTLWCLVETNALSMTLFFSFGIPLYGLGAVLYVAEILLDLRRHRVL
jgi:hypothetical protein